LKYRPGGLHNMRLFVMAAAAMSVFATDAVAADKPLFGPAPAWVKPVEVPTPGPNDGAAIKILLSDQQVRFERGGMTTYVASMVRIDTPQGLAAGNVRFGWRPETDTLTVHKLAIRRGDQVIDILSSGQTFTILRREQNLESATLDGVLTATMQPEDLQVGDILEFAISIASADPVLRGHVEQVGAMWNGVPFQRAHLRMEWPEDLKLRIAQTGALSAVKPRTVNGVTSADILMDGVQPTPSPKGAPARFRIGRRLEATDFASWADLSALMAPLYERASVVPSEGPLAAELARIRALSNDSVVQTEAALRLVQDRIRYVALAMGAGGLTPADATTTWSRRYGDCKGKTALLLALLHGLGIKAEAVVVNTASGDGFDARLPMISLFNHVLVRAEIGGRTYWLDGTRNGDTALTRLVTPDYGWGLPIRSAGAALVRMEAASLNLPEEETTVEIDATGGINAPAPAKVVVVTRGDAALRTKLRLANLTGENRDKALREYWKDDFDFIDVKTTSAVFDLKTGEERLSMEGMAKLDWQKGYYRVDEAVIGYHADFSREPGRDQDAPIAVDHPSYSSLTETIRFPKGALDQTRTKLGEVKKTVAGKEYLQLVTLQADTFKVATSTRSIAAEFPYSVAPIAQAELRALADRVVAIWTSPNYVPTKADIDNAMATDPDTAAGFIQRASLLYRASRFGDAIKDADRAIALDPKNVGTLSLAAAARSKIRDFAGAQKNLDAAQAIAPGTFPVLHARAEFYEQSGRTTEAMDAYTDILKLTPNDVGSIEHRAAMRRKLGDFDGALADLETAAKLNPSAWQFRTTRASILRLQKKDDLALQEAAAVLAAKPDDVDSLRAAAAIYSAGGRFDDAVKTIDRAIQLSPTAELYGARSAARAKTDKAGRLADIDLALKLNPKYATAAYSKGRLLDETGDIQGAIAAYSVALDAKPGDTNVLIHRADLYIKAGQAALADKDLVAARAKAVQPVDFNNLCWLKATAGVALKSALDECDRALRGAANAADKSMFLDSRGLVLLRLERFDEAISDYTKALEARADQPSSLFGRAAAYARKGDQAKANADRERAMKGDPNVAAEFKGYGVTIAGST
jgi:tetratricopeptide (TPR) repeat protein/transglutaminase-like putative cysteine protease